MEERKHRTDDPAAGLDLPKVPEYDSDSSIGAESYELRKRERSGELPTDELDNAPRAKRTRTAVRKRKEALSTKEPRASKAPKKLKQPSPRPRRSRKYVAPPSEGEESDEDTITEKMIPDKAAESASASKAPADQPSTVVPASTTKTTPMNQQTSPVRPSSRPTPEAPPPRARPRFSTKRSNKKSEDSEEPTGPVDGSKVQNHPAPAVPVQSNTPTPKSTSTKPSTDTPKPQPPSASVNPTPTTPSAVPPPPPPPGITQEASEEKVEEIREPAAKKAKNNIHDSAEWSARPFLAELIVPDSEEAAGVRKVLLDSSVDEMDLEHLQEAVKKINLYSRSVVAQSHLRSEMLRQTGDLAEKFTRLEGEY